MTRRSTLVIIMSLLTIKHVMLRTQPVIPVAGIVHERKFNGVHVEFFRVIAQLMPSLQRHAYPIVLDRQKAIVDAVQCVQPNLQQLNCWRHIKHWVRDERGGNQDDNRKS